MSWFKMHRGWMDNKIFRGQRFSYHAAWLWMIEKAVWKKRGDLDRGEFTYTLRDMATTFHWSPNKVSRFVNILCHHNMLETRKDGPMKTSRTIYKIKNFDKYQDVSRDTEQVTGEGTDEDTSEDNDKEIKKGRTNSDAGASGEIHQLFPEEAPPSKSKTPTVKDACFDMGKPMLKGVDDPGKLIGKLLKDNKRADVHDAIMAARGKGLSGMDAFRYCQGVLTRVKDEEDDDWDAVPHAGIYAENDS